MSEDDKGFLTRWSQRKRDAGKSDAAPVVPDAPEQPAKAAPETAAGEAEPPFDLESLPKLDEITANTDMTAFFRKGVPESIRNAALRKSWALDPAIRNYVNPALDYAYDWNTPGGVPGAGELAPGTDVARMVSQIMGGIAKPTEPVDRREPDEADRRNAASDDAAGHQADTSPPASSMRLSEARSAASEQDLDVGPAESSTSDPGQPQDEPRTAHGAFASQQDVRRHGSARPK